MLSESILLRSTILSDMGWSRDLDKRDRWRGRKTELKNGARGRGALYGP